MPLATAQLSPHGALRLKQATPLVKRRQRWRSSRRCALERLEDADVEDVVDAGTLRKVEPVRDVADAFCDLERASIPRAKLAPWSWQQGLRRLVENAQEHPITHRELQLAVVAVIVTSRVLLSL